MSDFQLKGPYAITASDCDALLATGSGNAALLYIYLLRHQGRLPAGDEAARLLNMSASETEAAVLCLQRAGLLESRPAGTAPGGERPAYRADEIASGIGGDPDFAGVVSEVEKLLGKILSSSDMQILYAIYDWRGLPAVVILILAHYCVWETRRKFGPGANPPTMRQIDREAAAWERAGIFTMDAAERHVRELELRQSARSETLKLLGISGRPPTPTEGKYIDGWLSAGLTPALIGAAYDKTVVNTGKMTWKYCDTILQSWIAKGIKCEEEIDALDRKSSSRRPPAERRGRPGLSAEGVSLPGSHELSAVAKVREMIEQREKKG